MNQKQVCQLDSQGYFTNVTVADESPLEPGVFLIPDGCVETKPPKVFPDQRVKWVNDNWVYEDIPLPPTPPEPVQPSPIEMCKGEAKYLLAVTDWSQLPDAAAALKNKAEFDRFRATVRMYLINPVEKPGFPNIPDAEW
jgi:hypothetical protein